MKQVICLGKNSATGYDSYQFALWYPIAAGSLPQANGSVWNGASAAENLAIQNGTVKEEVESFTIPAGCQPATIKDIALRRWNVRNAEINGIGNAQYLGVYEDSVSGWSA